MTLGGIFGHAGSPLEYHVAEQQRQTMERYYAAQQSGHPNPFAAFAGMGSLQIAEANTIQLAEKFSELKRSVESIDAEPFDGASRRRIENKINRLQKAGAVAQAAILEGELRTKDSLIRLKEWDYKILTLKTIEKFQKNNIVTATADGLRVHIDRLESYCGNPQTGEAKDRIIPDAVLDKLEEAKERELFDDFAVLWVEKVIDPLLLGTVFGCEDYFFITEWGDDITFEQLTKGE